MQRKFQLNNLFRLVWRSIWRDRLASCLNLIGLSCALTSSLCIYFWIRSELQRDRIFGDDERIYQVINHVKQTDGNIRTLEWTPALLAGAMERELPEVSRATTVLKSGLVTKGALLTGSNSLRATEWYASEGFFDVFPYTLIEGAAKDALKGINRIVISDRLAQRAFGRQTGLVGKQVNWHKGEEVLACAISGIFRHPGNEASEDMDVLIPFLNYARIHPELNDWKNNEPSTYVLLNGEVKEDDLRKKLTGFLAAKNGDANQSLDIRKYADKYLYATYENGVAVGGRILYVRLFALVGMLIIVVACVNFMNLAIAKSSAKIKQIGIRKLMGAGRWSLVRLILFEAGVVTMLASLCTMVMLAIIFPVLQELTAGKLIFYRDSTTAIAFILLHFALALLAGCYPALYFSGVAPKMALRGFLPTSIFRTVFSKVLVIFQLGISMLLVVVVAAVYKQMAFVHSNNLGMEKEQILLIAAEGPMKSRLELFMDEIKGLTGVQNVSGFNGSLTVNVTGTEGVEWTGKAADKKIAFKYLFVGNDFIQTLGIRLESGMVFDMDSSTKSFVLINTAAAKAMELSDPVGSTVKLWGEEKTIAGVTGDFHYESLYKNVEPCLLVISPKVDNIAVKASSSDMAFTIKAIEGIYSTYNPDLPFDFEFLDAQYDALYDSENRVMILGKYFAALAIVISLLGVFGLMAFSLERKRKEIGVRKIVGASMTAIVVLMVREFAMMGAIAIAIAFPISWTAANSWLDNFAYHIPMGAAEYLYLCLSVGMLVIGMTAVQAYISGNTNILENLRD